MLLRIYAMMCKTATHSQQRTTRPQIPVMLGLRSFEPEELLAPPLSLVQFNTLSLPESCNFKQK
jgi:hypothetical protein